MQQEAEQYCWGCGQYHKASVMTRRKGRANCPTCVARIEKKIRRSQSNPPTLKINHATLRQDEQLILQHSTHTSDFTRWFART